MDSYIKKFKEISIADIAVVGGKNSSLGEMFSKLSSRGIPVPVKEMIATMISKGKDALLKIGLCGQGGSDFPEFTKFLVEQGIDSISFNHDALLKGMENINRAELSSVAKI